MTELKDTVLDKVANMEDLIKETQTAFLEVATKITALTQPKELFRLAATCESLARTLMTLQAVYGEQRARQASNYLDLIPK